MAYRAIPASTSTSWAQTEATFHLSKIPTLTKSVYIPCGLAPTGGALATNISDAGKEGGAIKGINTSWTQLVASKVYQNVATSKIAVSFRASLGTIGSGFFSFLGVSTTGGTNAVVIGTNFALHTTNFALWGNNGSATAPTALGVADTTTHTFCMISDATTVTAYIDAVSKGTLATNVANYPTTAMSPAILEGGTPTVAGALYEVVYSFV